MASPSIYVIATEPQAKIPYGEGYIYGHTSTQVSDDETIASMIAAGIIREISLAEHAQYGIKEQERRDFIDEMETEGGVVISDANTARDVILGID